MLRKILDHHQNSNLNITIPVQDFVNDIAFRIGRDFKLDISLGGTDSVYKKISINRTNFKNEFNDIQIETLTGFYHGTCTILKINDQIKTPAIQYSRLAFNFNGTNINNLPHIQLIFTSKNNSYGSFWQLWMEGEKYDLIMNPHDKLHYVVNLRKSIAICWEIKL